MNWTQTIFRFYENCRYLFIRTSGNSYLLYVLLLHLKAFEELIIEKDTQICIEGFSRSANSFMALFFAHWNPGIKAAHHVHLPLQVRMAIKYQIPAIVIIRHPLDAIGSLLIREKFLYPWVAIKTYSLFYQMISKYRDHFILANFDVCITQPEKIFDQTNNKFKKAFNNGMLTGELKDNLFAVIDLVNQSNRGDESATSRPSALRNNLKQAQIVAISRHRLYQQALKTYQDITKP